MTTTHNLPFEVAPCAYNVDPDIPWQHFRVGTCSGLWRQAGKSYEILAISNTHPGNGHFEDVLEWFEFSCRRDNCSLKVLEIWNEGFREHLIEKRGFKQIPGGAEKKWKQNSK